MNGPLLTTRRIAAAPRPRRTAILALANLVMLVFLLAVAMVPVDPEAAKVDFAAGIILVILAVLCFILYEARVAPEVILFGTFVVWTGLTGLVARDYAWFWFNFHILAQLGALAFAVAQITLAKRSITGNLLIVLSCSGLLCLYGWISGDFGAAAEVGERARAASFLANPNTFGFFMIYGVVALAYFWGTTESRLARLLIPWAAAAFAFSLLFSASRKSFLCLLVFVAAWVWFCYRKQVLRSWRVVAIVGAVAVGCVLLTLYMLEHTYLGERFQETAEAGGLGESRTLMYVEGLRLFYRHPIMGVGLGNFTPLSSLGTYSHSEYIEVLSTTGIVGALLYFPIYVVLWFRLRRIERARSGPKLKYQTGVFKALIICLLFLGFGTPLFIGINFWFIMASLIGYTFAVDARHRTPMTVPRPWRRAAVAR